MSPALSPRSIVPISSITIENLEGDILDYPEQFGPAPIDQGADASLSGLSGSGAGLVGLSLTVSIEGMSPSQILSVRHQGMGSGQIGFQSGIVYYDGAAIGEATGGAGGTLTIILSTDSVDAVTALIRNLTYADTGDVPSAGQITIAFSDESGTLGSAVVTVNVTPVNDPPQAGDDSFLLDAGDVIAGNLTDNDFDPDDDPIDPPSAPPFHVASLTEPDGTVHLISEEGTSIVGAYGTLTLDASGAFTYTADNADALAPGETAIDEFDYTIIDDGGAQSTATIKFTVIGPFSLHVTNLDGDTLIYPERSPSLLLDTDEAALVNGTLTNFDGVTLTVSVDQASGSEIFSVIGEGNGAGQINVSNGVVSFGGEEIGLLISEPGEPLSVVFNASASANALSALLHRIAYADASETPSDKAVTIMLAKGAAILSVSHLQVLIENSEDAPIANADIGTVTAGSFLTGKVTENDYDPDNAGAVLTVTGFNAGSSGSSPQAMPGATIEGIFGTLTLNANGTYTYIANKSGSIPVGETAQDVFTYTVGSSAGGEASAQIAITIENPPAQTLFTFSNFDGDALNYHEQSGEILVDQNATAKADGIGWDGVKLLISLGGAESGESIGLLSREGAGQIGVSGSEVSFSRGMIGTLVQLSATSLELTLNAAASDAAVSAVLKSIRYDNPLEILNAASRVVTVKASIGNQVFGSDSATFLLTPVDDPLLPTADTNVVMEDTAVFGNVLTNDIDPDRPPPLLKELSVLGAVAGTATPSPQPMTGPLVFAGVYGTLILSADGSFTYRADHADDLIAGETVRDTFTYLARNDTGDEASAALVFTVNGADEAKFGSASADVLTGGRGADTLDGREGNDRLVGGDGNDTLIGGAGHDTLDGGSGADLMQGGNGNDTFIVDNNSDILVEGGKGTDTILTTVDVTLKKKLSIEIIKSIGPFSSRLKLVGNEFNQKIFGGPGADVLNGKGGNDILQGGKGKDAFVFDSRNVGVDIVLDFKIKEDKIHLAGKAFGLRKGVLKAAAFLKVNGGSPEAVDPDDRIIYDRSKGLLYADLDGSGDIPPILLAIFRNKPDLSLKDFLII
ncbi:Ig-like domain-containing protein [Microvirga sp. 2TAF3]|uniref:Ig-like domain-containing protein n=1 Tax=Microvirga sp. 2TAF3 TaxID=3233014 RepID=UPI003F992B71